MGRSESVAPDGLTLIDTCDAMIKKGLRNRAGGSPHRSPIAQLLERHGDGITLRSA
jgi:hypothetical protein